MNLGTTTEVNSSRPWRRGIQVLTFVMILLTVVAVTVAQQFGPQETQLKSRQAIGMPSLTKQPGKSSRPSIHDGKMDIPLSFSPRVEDPAHQADIDSIREIRATLGSSVVDGLGELGDQNQMDLQFNEELSRLVKIEKPRLNPLSPIEGPDSKSSPQGRLLPLKDRRAGLNEPSHPMVVGRTDSNPASPELQAVRDRNGLTGPTQPTWYEYPNSPAPQPVRVANPYSPQMTPQIPAAQRVRISAVRAVAVQLEQAAAELEGLQLYEEADSVRSAANGMWKRARQIEAQASSTSDLSSIQ